MEAECLQRDEFGSYQEAYEVVTNYIRFYNERRMHGNLYYDPSFAIRSN
ncbi:IS3 family transposase [Paenibacillus rigui]